MTMVIAQHCGLLPSGWTGVWLFYVISGFVISRNFIAEKAAFGPSRLRHYLSFAVRRLFRIVPPYAAYIGVCLIVVQAVGLPEQYSELPYLGTFTYNWRMIFSVQPQFFAFAHLWTISVEEQFYLVFPIVILLARRNHAIFVLIAMLVLVPVLRNLISDQMAAHSWDPERIAFGIYASSMGQFDAFAYGALLAHFEGDIRKNPRISRRIAVGAFAIAIVYVTAFIVVNFVGGARGIDVFRNVISGIMHGEKREVFCYVVVDLCAVTIVAAAITGWRALKMIEHPALVRVGQASYGGYLVHALVLFAVGAIAGRFVGQAPIPERIGLFVVVWLLTVALAWFSYSFFERKIIRQGHKVSQWIILKGNAKPVVVSI